MQQLVRKAVRAFKPYEAPYQLEGIKLDANENIYPVSSKLKQHMQEWVQNMSINYYPDTSQTKLREAIANYYQLDPQQVSIGVGSDQLIDCILRAFVEKEEYVVSADPSFSMYEVSVALNEGQLIKVPLNGDFSYNVEALLNTITTYQPKVIFICHPNNPTGTTMDYKSIEKIIQTSKGIVVIDEAYGEFCETSGIDFIKTYENVVVLKTFSKAYGLAGARIGYALGSDQCIAWINAVKPPYAVSSFSEEVAYYTITHPEEVDQIVDEIKATRQWVSENLLRMGIQVWPSQTNFIWLYTELPIQEGLREEQIAIKRWSDNYYRMSIGTREQMENVVRCINRIKEGYDAGGTD